MRLEALQRASSLLTHQVCHYSHIFILLCFNASLFQAISCGNTTKETEDIYLTPFVFVSVQEYYDDNAWDFGVWQDCKLIIVAGSK